MKVIIIYGAPGVGKMSVAKALVKITNSKYLPHNLIFELIMPIISEKTNDDVLWDLYEDIKINIISSAKIKKRNIVLTEIYDNPLSNERFKEFITEMKKLKIKFDFVHLICDEKSHHKRVQNPERKKYKKVSSPIKLRKIMKKGNLDSKIPFVDSLEIDTSKLSAKKTAEEIKRRLILK